MKRRMRLTTSLHKIGRKKLRMRLRIRIMMRIFVVEKNDGVNDHDNNHHSIFKKVTP